MRFRVLAVLAALITSSACFIYGALHQTENQIYTGIRSLNASDYNTNTSWIDQSREGHFLLKNKFTAEPQAAVFVRPIYYILSQPFRLTNLTNTVVLHILLVLAGAVLLILLFPMLTQLGLERQVVDRAFLLLVFSSGIGFLVHQWLRSVDIGVPESTLFLSLSEAPHFVYSMLFLWAGITAIFARNPTIYFFSLLILWWEHPFDAVILIGIGTMNLWLLDDRKKQILTLLISAGVSLPPFLYYQHLKNTPAFSGWGSAQNLMSSPNVLAVLSGFFPLIVLGIPGFLHLKRDPEKQRLLKFLSVWIVVQAIMIYAPFPFQRRLIAGLQFPLAILSAYGLSSFRKPVVAVLILLSSFGNLWITKNFIQEIQPRQMPHYMSASYADAFRWLSQQDKEAVVLSGFVTGNFLPGFSGVTSYMGHSSLTPNIAMKRKEAAEFFQKPDLPFLIKNRVRFIFWGLEERHLTNVSLEDLFEVAYKNAEVTILIPRLRPPRGIADRLSSR